jgi:quercetin dioxygenase-like cupin family protein
MFKAHIAIGSAVSIAGTGILLTQDPVKTEPQHSKVILENASVRVLQVQYAAGTKSAMHQHPDNVVIALSAAKVRFTMPDKTAVDQELPNEGAMFAPAGSHAPANTGSTPVNAIVVEFKGAAGKATLPATRDNMTMKTLA